MVKRKHKVTREEIAWWIYLVIMVALVIYGFRDSAAAEVLIRAIRVTGDGYYESCILDPEGNRIEITE